MRAVTFLVTVVALLTGFYRYFDSRLDQFYIFDPSHLHDLSQRAIAAHGNDTRAVVNYIVSELEEKTPGTHINHDEEWVFNNAGGAMGAMYIIHASASPTFEPLPTSAPLTYLGITEYLIIFGSLHPSISIPPL